MSALRSDEFFAFRRALRESPDDAGLAAVVYDWCLEREVLLGDVLDLFAKGGGWELHLLLAEFVERRFGRVPALAMRNIVPPSGSQAMPHDWHRFRGSVLRCFPGAVCTVSYGLSLGTLRSAPSDGYLRHLLEQQGFRLDLVIECEHKPQEGLVIFRQPLTAAQCYLLPPRVPSRPLARLFLCSHEGGPIMPDLASLIPLPSRLSAQPGERGVLQLVPSETAPARKWWNKFPGF